MATFTGAARTANTFVGTAADDLFRFAAADINASDRITGGVGRDRLQLTSAGLLAGTALAGVKGVEQIALANGANAIKLLDVNFTGGTGRKIAVSGGSGNDRIDASSLTGANRIDVSSGGGLDVLRGGAGADVFRFAAANLGGDTVVGGGGSDLLLLTTGGKLGTGGIGLASGIETVRLAAAGNIISLTNANFVGVAGAKIVVTGGAGADSVDASALTGANRVDITAGADADMLRGGAGADVFRFTAANMAGDIVVGGLGSDLLVLTTGGKLGTGGITRVSGVETIALAAGGNPITLTNANFAGVLGAKIAVRGSAGADIVDASGLTGANAIDVTAGLGADVLRGGAGADVFRFAAANMAGDTVSGGLGSDLLVLTTGGALGTGGITRVSGVETIALAAGGNPITLTNANFAGVVGAKIVVSGGASDNTVNAAGLTGVNRIDVTAGAGFDTLRGGAGADVFRFAFLNLRGDVIAGGAGSDTVLLTTAGGLPSNALRSMTGVERVLLAADGNAITLENANFTGVAGAKITVIGGAGANPNTVNASGLTGANAIDVTAGGGLDVLRGGAGNDVFRFTKAQLDGDTVQGGGGIDTLLLTTTGGLGGTALAHVTGVETIRFAVGGNTLALIDANFAGVAGGVIKVIGGGGPNLVDAGQLTGVNKIDVTAGKDFDSLFGGAGDDVFRFARLDLTADDTVTGGTGFDMLVLSDTGALAVDALAGVTGIDRISLAAGGNSLKLTDANYAVGTYFGEIDFVGAAGSSVIDGTDLTGTHGIYFVDGGAADTIMGGAGRDRLVFQNGNVFVTGDTFNGGGGNVDVIFIDRSMDFLGSTISNVEQLLTFGSGSTSVTISGENAAGFDTFGSSSSNAVDDIFTVQLSAGSTTDLSNLTLVQASAGDAIKVVATGGSTSVTLSSSIASFTGSADDDTVRFASDQTFAGGAVIAGGGGTDQITLTTSGNLAADALVNVTGIEQIVLAAGGNALTLTDANFAVPIAGQLIIFASAGSSSITGSDLSGTNGLYIYDGGGADTIIGGAGSDVLDLRGRVFVAGDTFDGGDGNDGIAIDRSLDLLGSTISHVEQLLNFGTNAVNVSISGENAAAMLSMGNAGANGVDDVFTVRLSAGSTTDLSNLTLYAPDAADAINVVATGGSTSVTLSSSIASFTGSAGADRVSFAPGGGYNANALIKGGSGNDRFFIHSTAEVAGDIIDGGSDFDTIEVLGDTDFTAATISGIESLILRATDAAGTAIRADVTATVSGSQAAALVQVIPNGTFFGTVETLVVNADTTSLDLSHLNFIGWSASEDRVVINGTGGTDTIIGTSQNDVIHGSVGLDILSGGGGDDQIDYNVYQTSGMDGGSGTDTIVFKYAPLSTLVSITVDLAAGSITEFTPDPFAFNGADFENADFTENVVKTTMIGTDGDNILIGGSADDTITGGFGADTLTGGGGADSFVWNDKLEGGDTVTDFVRGTDHLVFSASQFGFTGASFDTVVVENGSSTDFSNADLILTTASLTAAQASAFLATDAFVNGPIFLIARGENFQNILYYSANPVNSPVEMIADLGFGGSPNTFGLGDFLFI
ncbi:calcium-binding protein [Novosphingobium sp. PASSN1]|uniref:beta strand repeat-containing protein n=1 Tax=Novosphingobium sp. PASSN1 TaxID=2015561 RepID=UPI000BC6FA53|nr:calcium-binding protein [Novosphingobium sp. PASSN1]OYU36302.1 MAG: hypothetical protein CFE35_03015 [Novosphingobium sp. PASSN1]